MRLIIKNLYLGLIFYIAIFSIGQFYIVSPDGTSRLELTHNLVTQASIITSTTGPIKYAPLQSLLMAPIYAVGYYYGVLSGEDFQVSVKLGAIFVCYLFLPLIISTLCVLYFRILKQMGVDENINLISTFLLFSGAFLLPYAGGLFSEPLSALLILISFYYFYVAPTTIYISSNRKNFFFLGLLILNNFVFLPYFGLMILYVFWNSWGRRGDRSEAVRMIVEGALIMGASAALYLCYNYARYGQFFNFGYEGEGFTTSWLVGLFGLTFSIGKGLLIFSPLTVVCILYFVFKSDEMESWQKYVFGATLISFFIYLSIYANWDPWHGGLCWGPRFLLPFVPLIHLMFPLLLNSMASFNRVVQAGFVLAVVWAIGMNLLAHLDPDAVGLKDGLPTIAEAYSRKIFIPEKSVIFDIWKQGIFSLKSLKFLAVLGFCASLLWVWKKKI